MTDNNAQTQAPEALQSASLSIRFLLSKAPDDLNGGKDLHERIHAKVGDAIAALSSAAPAAGEVVTDEQIVAALDKAQHDYNFPRYGNHKGDWVPLRHSQIIAAFRSLSSSTPAPSATSADVTQCPFCASEFVTAEQHDAALGMHRATVMDEKGEREAFEAEMRCEEEWGYKNLRRDPRGTYSNSWTAVMWKVWQARAAIKSSGDQKEAAVHHGTLFEHEDGRAAVTVGDLQPTFTNGDPRWHRAYPVEVHSASLLPAVQPAAQPEAETSAERAVAALPNHPIATMNWSPLEKAAIAEFGRDRYAAGRADAPVAEPVAWDGKLHPTLQEALNSVRMEAGHSLANTLEHEVRSSFQALWTTSQTRRRMYRAAQDRLDVIDAATPDPLARPPAPEEGKDAELRRLALSWYEARELKFDSEEWASRAQDRFAALLKHVAALAQEEQG